MPTVTSKRAIMGIALLVLSILGYILGIPLVTQEACIAGNGIYAEGICYPSGTTFAEEDPEDPVVTTE
jgi:hypothetical protein